MTALTQSSTPSKKFNLLVGALATPILAVVTAAALHLSGEGQKTQLADERLERATAEFCGRHDALRYAQTMQSSLEQAAAKINPSLKEHIPAFMGGLGFALAQPGVTQMPVYGKGIYALVPSSLEGEALRPIQILMQTADNKCVAFGLSGFGEIVPADPLVNKTANNASFFKKISSHGEAPACDQALRSLSNPSI